MDYEKAYKEALERAKEIHDSHNASSGRKEWLESIFPVLAESEDERIRKEIVNFIRWAIDRGSITKEQREGLHFTPLNRLIQKIPSENWNDTVNNYAKKLCDCLIKEGYLKDADVLQGYISYMNGNNVPMATMDEQEQPEVDLDFQVFAKEMDAVFNLPKDVTENTEENPLNWEYAIARHFYELGRNARKED